MDWPESSSSSDSYWVSFQMVNLCPVFFYLNAYLRCTEPFRMKPEGVMCHFCFFLSNNRQHSPVCAKTISSWVRKVLCVAIAHMSLGSLQGAAASATLLAGDSLMSILHAGDWGNVSTPARHYFSPYITTNGLAPGLCTACAVLGLNEEVLSW